MNESNQNPLIDTSEDAFNALNSQEQKASIEEIGKVDIRKREHPTHNKPYLKNT